MVGGPTEFVLESVAIGRKRVATLPTREQLRSARTQARALPEPRPAPAATITGVGAGSGADAGTQNYLLLVRSQIERVLVRHGYHRNGQLAIRLSLAANGQVLDRRIIRSSGDSDLERAVLASVQDAAPYPEFPADLRARQKLTFIFPIEVTE